MNLKDFSRIELRELAEELGDKSYRGDQLFEWMYKKEITSIEEAKNLSKSFIDKLSDYLPIMTLEQNNVLKSNQDETTKFLFETCDNNLIETVLMKYKYGNTICISSQAGCRMGCKFCASAIGGLSRNLTPGEMIDQYLLAKKYLGENIGHVVIMGTGEPFDNLTNVMKFIEIITDDKGIGISKRAITVSTCGLIPEMRKFYERFPQINIAISLHSANDSVRSELMPINNKYNIKDLIAEARHYTEKTGRRITFEYALIEGVNDGVENIHALASLVRGINCHINIIPLNPVEEVGMKSVSQKAATDAAALLEGKGVTSTVRRELGTDIESACGQLRLKQNRR